MSKFRTPQVQIYKLSVDTIIKDFNWLFSSQYYPVRKPPESILSKFNKLTVLHRRNNYFWRISREYKRVVLSVTSEVANRYGEHFEVRAALSFKNLLEDLDEVADNMVRHIEFSLT